MAVTNYYTVNGEIIGEKVGAGARTDYLRDALGSVVGTVNQSAQVVNTYRFKPYGAQLAKTGTGTDPAFRWVGSQGYRQTGKKYSDVYVRARHYDTVTARWGTRDPIVYRPFRFSFVYVLGRPIILTDRLGLLPQQPAPKPVPTPTPSPQRGCCPNAFKRCDVVPPGTVPPEDNISRHCRTGWVEAPYIDQGTKPWEDCVSKGSCAAILKRIGEVAQNCQFFCDKSNANRGGYPPGAPWWGTTICCQNPDGSRQFCGFRRCTGDPDFPKDGCVLFCLVQHERRHTHHPLPPPDACPGDIGIPPNVDPYRWAECDAYSLELNCLIDMATRKGCNLELVDGMIRLCLGATREGIDTLTR